jgi:neopullulanase
LVPVPFFLLAAFNTMRKYNSVSCRLLPVRSASWLALFLIVLAAISSAQVPQISKVEPPNWWANYESPVMVLLYGENLPGAKISVSYPGVTIQKTQVQPDGKHAFVWLDISPKSKPGTAMIRMKTPSGENQFAFPLLRREPVNGRFQGITQDDVIYLIMPDRFADGDPSNNQPTGAAARTYDRASPQAYHGGDLHGVQQHLSYLKDLGVTTVWLNPLYDNSDAASDYHGYHAVDLYKVEDHFGTMQDFQALVTAAHQQGLKVLLDTVPNHVGPKHSWATSQPAPGWLHGTAEDHINTDYDFPPVADPHAVPRSYRSALDGWFANALPDLAQENPLVAQYLLQNALWWIESSGIDGFRIDTFPYVPRSFWSYYLTRIRNVYPNFFSVGEVYNSDPVVVSYFAGGQTGFDGVDTHLPTPFDFPLNSAIRDVVNHGASAKKIEDVLRQDRLYPHPENLVTFIGNHDMKRFLTDAGGSTEKLNLALSLIVTLRGIPQLYYGDEIGMSGGDDPDNRHDFPGGFPGDKQDAFSAQGRNQQEQDVFQHLQGLLKLRRDHPALREGKLYTLFCDDQTIVYVREYTKPGDARPSDRLLMVMNNSDVAREISIPIEGTPIADVHTAIEITGGKAPASAANGGIKLSVVSRSLLISDLK